MNHNRNKTEGVIQKLTSKQGDGLIWDTLEQCEAVKLFCQRIGWTEGELLPHKSGRVWMLRYQFRDEDHQDLWLTKTVD